MGEWESERDAILMVGLEAAGMSLSVIWRNEGSVVAVPGQREPLGELSDCREAVLSPQLHFLPRPTVFWAHPALESST